MPYIGKTPTVGNFQVCDAISVVNGQAAYTLQVGGVNVAPESANHMLVSLNGILQKPGSSFTISGSTMTFASNLATGDVIDFVTLLGNVLDIGQPSDDTVTAAKLNDNVISGQTALGATPADTDEFLVSDAGTLKKVDYSYIKGLSNWSESSGNLLPSNASYGIYLGVNSATAANLLDDYEEGTFTPTIKISGSTTGIAYSVQGGHYTKIGNRVIASAEIALSDKGSNTGNVSMINLPFTTSNDNHQTAFVYNDRVSSPNGDVLAYIPQNGTSINFYQSRTDGTNNGNLTGNEMNDTSYLIMFMTYKTG